jgi:hypothetical protein
MNISISDFQPLTLMLSSRCRDTFLWEGKQRPLSDLRRAIKEAVEKIEFEGKKLFEVWIHEDETGGHSWDRCMSSARSCDIFLALYNGNAGWDGSHGTTERLGDHVGICHAEMDEAFHKSPDKVRCIRLLPLVKTKPGDSNDKFQMYFDRQNLNSPEATDGEEAIERAKDAAVGSLMKLARLGVGVSGKGSYYAGEALEWTRLDFDQRRKITTGVVTKLLAGRTAKSETTEGLVIMPVKAGQKVAFRCDCVPSSMSTAGARELVGQPFLKDWKTMEALPKDVAGPVHVIACHKSVTESQAIKQLGFPDAVVVSAPFGVYVADRVQCIQMVFISNCRDETSTRHGVQHFFHWLTEQREEDDLAKRAVSRRKICAVTASEWNNSLARKK